MANSKDEFITAAFALSVDPQRLQGKPMADMATAWPELNRKMHESAKAYGK